MQGSAGFFSDYSELQLFPNQKPLCTLLLWASFPRWLPRWHTTMYPKHADSILMRDLRATIIISGLKRLRAGGGREEGGSLNSLFKQEQN